MTDIDTPNYNLLMLSGDSSIAAGIDGAFHQMLARFSRYWQRIDILTPTAPNAKQRVIHNNVHVHPAPYHRGLQALFIKRKGEELLAERTYHLVSSHDYGFNLNGIGAWWLLRNKAIPYISDIQHVEGYPRAINWRERLWRIANMRYIPFAGKHAAAFRVTNSRDVIGLLKQFGIPDEKILVLTSVYLDLAVYQPAAVEKQYDVLFVGRLASNKGILLLLDAIAQIAKTTPTVKLAIRGDGPLRESIERKIAEQNLGSNVVFVPRLANTQAMAELYSSARMLVCASTVEGNPRVTIEAMACAVPVLSTPVGIMPEVIVDGENGYLFQWDAAELAQKIRLLLDDEALRNTIAQAGRESVQQFEADKMIREYAMGYHDLIGQIGED